MPGEIFDLTELEENDTEMNINVMSSTSPITPSDMKPAEIMYEMREIQDTWRQQNFFLSDAQKQRYADLLKMRRDRVQFFYE